MRTIPASGSSWLAEALAQLRAGGVVALPTETVYGLASALDPKAIERVYAFKGRASEKALPMQLDSVESALDWGFDFSAPARRVAERFWPGPLTLLLGRPATCPLWFAPGSTLLALRVPDHPVALGLLRAWKAPLAVTSANRSGQGECLRAEEVACALHGAEDMLLLDGGPAPGGVASTVVDASGPEPLLKREGPIGFSEIVRVWRGGNERDARRETGDARRETRVSE